MSIEFTLIRWTILAVGILTGLSQPLLASDPFASPSDPFASPSAVATRDKHRCLSLVAGFAQGWFFVMSEKFCAGGTDDVFVRASWPKESIDGDRAKGFKITNVAGDESGWIVVMNDRSPLTEQIYFGPGEFPKSDIDEQLKKGFRITSLAGYDDQWVVDMSKGTRISRQLFTTPGSYGRSLEWMEGPYSHGYRITSLAGDNGTVKEQRRPVTMMIGS